MSVVSLSFAATLPTYTSVGANGTVFTNNTLPTSGQVLVNTNDSSTGLPSVLNSNLSANGLSYSAQAFSISGNTLSVIYSIQSSAGDAQQGQAADQAFAIGDNLPGNEVDFTPTSGVSAGATASASYNVATKGVLGNTPANNVGTAASFSSGSDGSSLSIESISAGAGNTLEVVFTLKPALPAGTSTSVGASTDLAKASSAPTANDTLSNLSPGVVSALETLSRLTGQNASQLNSGQLLANVLSSGVQQQLSAYNIVAGFDNASSNNVATAIVA